MKVVKCEQGSTEWHLSRLGVVTASEADALITPLWKPRTGQGVETYLHKKLAEKLLGWSPDMLNPVGTWAMDMGSIIEKLVVPWYAFTYDVTPQRVGFCVSDDGAIGCSPDGLVGADGGLEIKAPLPPTHIKYLLNNEVPAEYLAQIHFSMMVTGRAWWDFVSFSRTLPPLVIRVERNESIIAAIKGATDAFLHTMAAKHTHLKSLIAAAFNYGRTCS